ncbi:uroporphyrinogen-III C-methyltransferase [Chloroflexia bacterium SDU3-3]|nr:uroporphyrinogen-III C-methyltransferase [Chloroflexia bacterium SDU3-3]
MSGKAYLVGAGPGRADLITVRGLNLLRAADVVIYDRLIAPELLEELPQHATRIFVGKGPDRHVMRQDAISALVVEQVRAGYQVVRLKGGDPCVFGHAGEEALALAEAGLPFEIVPGVSSALAAPAYAGVPVTQRGVSTAFAVVTGHTAPGAAADATDWAALARIPTLVVLMGVKRLDQICAALIEAGRAPATPALLVSRGATEQQQTLLADLASLPQRYRERPLPTPSVLVVGEVAAMHAKISWFQPSGLGEGFFDLEDGE